MDFIEEIGIGEERAETGFGAKVNGPAAMLNTGEIRGIGVAKSPPAQGDKTREDFLFRRQF
jgi:hypothetical protein